jgi:hypothetical protein
MEGEHELADFCRKHTRRVRISEPFNQLAEGNVPMTSEH